MPSGVGVKEVFAELFSKSDRTLPSKNNVRIIKQHSADSGGKVGRRGESSTATREKTEIVVKLVAGAYGFGFGHAETELQILQSFAFAHKTIDVFAPSVLLIEDAKPEARPPPFEF